MDHTYIPQPELSSSAGIIRHLLSVAADLGYEAALCGADRAEIVKRTGYGPEATRLIDGIMPDLRYSILSELFFVSGEDQP